MEKNRRGYWGVLPGEVADDPRLTIAARYLYVILSSMAGRKGFCWPSNEELSEAIKLSKRRTVELLGLLREAGFISIMFKPHGKYERRYIYCGMFPDRANEDEIDDEEDWCEKSHGEDAEDFTDPCENSHLPPAKNTFSNSSGKEKEKKQKENTPIVPTEKSPKQTKYDLAEDAKPILREYVGEDKEMARYLVDMIESRKELKATNSARAIKAMLGELDRCSGGSRANKIVLLRRAVSAGWKTIYPMRPDELPDKPPPGGPPAGTVVERGEVPTW